MFNLSGSELVFLLLLALIVLGPEKLPEAVRKFGKVYSELKKMSTGFQSELKTALDEPMREMRETADAFKKAVNFDFDDDGGLVVSDDVKQPTEAPEKVQKFDFDDEGRSVPRPDTPPVETPGAETPSPETSLEEKWGKEPPMVRPPGPTFHSAAPQSPKVAEAVEKPASE
jgi:sec-independent protein translocase protein TatB